MPVVNLAKQREREAPSFANINLLGTCNARCFFCRGRDIEKEVAGIDSQGVPYDQLPRLTEFLESCERMSVRKLYITGQNTDSLLYRDLAPLITSLRGIGFQVGLRTNGYVALDKMDAINLCDLSVGYSIHTLSPVTSKMILGRKDIPDWDRILERTTAPVRVSIVLNRCNRHELFPLLRWIAQKPTVRYVQVRRVSTDRRVDELMPDMVAYEEAYSVVRDAFPCTGRMHGDAEVYSIYGKDVVFWRTVKTTIGSLNYFSDGTISDVYFVVEGYLANRRPNV